MSNLRNSLYDLSKSVLKLQAECNELKDIAKSLTVANDSISVYATINIAEINISSAVEMLKKEIRDNNFDPEDHAEEIPAKYP